MSYVSERCKSLRKVVEIYAGKQQKCLCSEISKGMKIFCEIDVHLHDGLDIVSLCRKVGISYKTYRY